MESAGNSRSTPLSGARRSAGLGGTAFFAASSALAAPRLPARMIARTMRVKGEDFISTRGSGDICVPPNFLKLLRTERSTSAAEVWPPLLRGRGGRIALVTETDAATLQIVGRHLDDDAIADARADTELAHLASSVGQNLMIVIELHPEVAVRQDFRDRTIELKQFFLRHPVFSS